MPLPILLLLLKLLGRRRRFESEHGLRQAVQRDRASVRAEPPARLRRTLEVQAHELHGARCWQLAPRGAGAATRLIYLHGGAHVAEIAPAHWALIAGLVAATGCTALVPIFPLAPEHDHRAAQRMAIELYRAHAGDDLVLMGDSSGGGFALALAQQAFAAGLPPPRDLVMLSPWLDLTLRHAETASMRMDDPWLAIPGLRAAAGWWCGGDDPAAPHLSPLYGPLRGLGRLHVYAGTQELFIDECRALRGIAAAQGVDLRWTEGHGMIHVWPLLPIAAARRAREGLAAIVRGDERTSTQSLRV